MTTPPTRKEARRRSGTPLLEQREDAAPIIEPTPRKVAPRTVSAYYVLPAGAVELVDHEREIVELKVGVADVRAFFPPYTDV